MVRCQCGQKLVECDHCHTGELICNSRRSNTYCEFSKSGAWCRKCHIITHIMCMDLCKHKNPNCK